LKSSHTFQQIAEVKLTFAKRQSQDLKFLSYAN